MSNNIGIATPACWESRAHRAGFVRYRRRSSARVWSNLRTMSWSTRAPYKLDRAVRPVTSTIYLHETLIRVVEVPRERRLSTLSFARRVMSSDCVPPTTQGSTPGAPRSRFCSERARRTHPPLRRWAARASPDGVAGEAAAVAAARGVLPGCSVHACVSAAAPHPTAADDFAFTGGEGPCCTGPAVRGGAGARAVENPAEQEPAETTQGRRHRERGQGVGAALAGRLQRVRRRQRRLDHAARAARAHEAARPGDPQRGGALAAHQRERHRRGPPPPTYRPDPTRPYPCLPTRPRAPPLPAYLPLLLLPAYPHPSPPRRTATSASPSSPRSSGSSASLGRSTSWAPSRAGFAQPSGRTSRRSEASCSGATSSIGSTASRATA